MKSPWLPRQGIVAQADDGVVIARGRIAGRETVVASIEGAYLGGSIGEVSGSKIAAALEMALHDCECGRAVVPVLLLETGGVRLQEANLGLAVIAEIHAAMVALRCHVPIIGVIAGMVGCFGGMSLAAALCNPLLVTRQARLGISGPAVIEQEAGIEEIDAADRAAVWSMAGGEQRYSNGMADELLDDDVDTIVARVRAAAGQRPTPRTSDVSAALSKLAIARANEELQPVAHGSHETSLGELWFNLLARTSGILESAPRSVLVADAPLADEMVRFLAVVPDAHNRFHRARHGEVGLIEAWTLAEAVHATIRADEGRRPRPIIAIVSTPGQAYGRREEQLGIHMACAAAVEAYASARLAGHPVIALLVGKAMAGAFLAHGYQANRILALHSSEVLIHAMSRLSAARITRCSVEELDRVAADSPPAAYGVRAFAQLGLLHKLIEDVNASEPTTEHIERVRADLVEAIGDVRCTGSDLSGRLANAAARTTRTASIAVRELDCETVE